MTSPHRYWFAGQVLPGDSAYGWVKEADGSTATLWIPYLQLGERVVPLRTVFVSRADCELFIRTEVLAASLEES